MTPLEQALGRADLRELIDDLYQDAGVRLGLSKQRIKAVWRGGGNPDIISLSAKTAHDFKTGETWNAWTFLTEVAGYSKAEAAAYPLRRAGLADERQAKRKAARRVQADERQDARRAAYLKRRLEAATSQQRVGETSGASGYLDRKKVSSIFETHEVAGAADASGEEIPGVTFGAEGEHPFVQFALRNVAGKLSGFQRIYDSACLPVDRDKDFYGSTKGAFVLLQPKGETLPKSGTGLSRMLEEGYEIAICEGFATGASIALARPKAFVFCALYAGNLANVAAALRTAYGYTRTLEIGPSKKKRKALDLCIWADFDESKTGQQKAHAAALKHDCYVRVPRFESGFGDFNDLHAARGLEAVKRTRRVTPDATLAFAKELGKQKLSAEKHVAPFALPDSGAALIVRAPQETGKTHRLTELVAGSGLRVLVVTHRESLAKNLAARLHFECYQDYPAYMLRDIPRLVICFDSLQKLTIGGELPSYDVLVLDESEQVLEHTTGRHIKHKKANFAALEHYLKTAPRIICADADAGRLTAETLKRFSPERVITWHRHEYHVAKGRRARFVYERDDVLDALETETRSTWYASDSLRHTRDLSAYLDHPATLTINSETATTDGAAAYLLDPTGQARAHGRMIASPSVQTGLSDDSDHWQHVMGSFGGYSSTPQDAMQALMRARRVQELTVHAARGRGEPISVQEAQDGAAALDDFEAQALEKDTFGTANPSYERLCAEVEAQRTRRQANYKQRLVELTARLGYTITYDLPQDLSPGELDRRYSRRAALKEKGLERYVADRVNAERIDEAKAQALEDKYALSQPDHFALEQYQLRAFYALPDAVSDSDLADMLRRDEYKALRDRVLRYENFIEPREVAEARARGELDVGVLRGDAKAHLLRHEYHRRLGAVIGLDSATENEAETWQKETDTLEAELHGLAAESADARTRRKGELNRRVDKLETDLAAQRLKTFGTTYNAGDESVKAFVRWCAKNYKALNTAGLVTGTLENLKVKPLETIGDSLRSCGLEQRILSKSDDVRVYALTFASVSGMANYSRPRRENWQFGQQTNIKTLNNGLLPKNAVIASGTGLITPLQKPKPDAAPSDWLDTFTAHLETGELDDFGPQKLRLIRQKVKENDTGWLHTLANSRATGRVLGAVR